MLHVNIKFIHPLSSEYIHFMDNWRIRKFAYNINELHIIIHNIADQTRKKQFIKTTERTHQIISQFYCLLRQRRVFCHIPLSMSQIGLQNCSPRKAM